MDQFLRKNLWVVNLVSLAFAAFFLATGTGALLSLLLIQEPAVVAAPLTRRLPRSKVAKARVAKRDAHDICANNIFNYKLRPCAEDMVIVDDDVDEGEEEITGEGVPDYCEGSSKLVATMASSDADWAFAMLKTEGETMPYRIGSDVPGLGTIKRVGWRLVLVDAESGPDCLLDLYPPPADAGATPKRGPRVASKSKNKADPPRRGRGRLSPELQKQVDNGIETVSATERNIDRGLVDSLIENSSALMSQARILPYERDGAVQGFKLYGIRRNSLLGKLGLRNGDIINSIGGIEMTSPDQALQAYTKLRSTSNITLDFTRRGRRQSMDYNIR